MYAPPAHLLVGESDAPPLLTKRSSAARTALLALLVILVSPSCPAACHNACLQPGSFGALAAVRAVGAAMLLVPRRNWLVLDRKVLAGGAVENLQFRFHAWVDWFFLANTIEVLIIGLGLGYFFDGVPRLNSSKALASTVFD
jgi:hypothetical protein